MVFKKIILVIFIFIFYSCQNADLKELVQVLKNTNTDSNESISINFQPVAVISLEDTSILKEGKSITFSAKESNDVDGSIASYVWRENKKIIGTKKVLVKEFTSGVHIVELEVKDNLGAISVARRQFTVERDYQKIEFDLSSIEEIATLGAPTKSINNINIDNNHLFASSDDGNIYFWELVIGELINPKKIKAHDGFRVSSILVNEKKIFSGSNDNSIKVWDRDTLELLDVIKSHTNTITSIVSNSNIFATSSLDKNINIFSLSDNALLSNLKGHKSPIEHLVAIDKFLISSSSDKIIKIWDTGNGFASVNTVDLIGHSVDFMRAYSNFLITASSNGDIILWDIFKGVKLKEIKTSYISSVEIYKNNLILGLSNGVIESINLDTLSKTNLLKLEHMATSIRVSEGVLVVGLENFTIKLFGNKQNFRQR